MSTATTQIAPKIDTGGHRRFTFFLVGAMGAAGIALFLIVVMFGSVYGTEFNAKTTDEREFMYYQVPWIELPISPVFREERSTSLGRFLVLRGYWKQAAPSRWDLVHVATVQGSHDAPAATLLEFFEASDRQGKRYWLEWTKQHRPLAKRHWSIVETLVRFDLYPYAAVAFEAADRALDADDYDEALRQELRPLIQHDLQLANQSSDRDRLARLQGAWVGIWPDQPAIDSRPSGSSTPAESPP